MTSDQGAGQPGWSLSAAKAELLARWRAGAAPALADTIQARSGGADAPASLQQARHWFRRDRLTNCTRRNIAFAAVLEARLDYDALTVSIDALAARHEALRTTLYERAGEVWQRIHHRPMVQHRCLDLRDSPAPLQTAVAEVNDVVQGGFDLADGPLAHSMLYRLTDTRHLMAIVCNHVVADGWSLGVALRDLDEIYQARAAGRAPSLPALPIQYRDYARWQRDWLTGTQARQQARYWEALLKDRPGKQLPAADPGAGEDRGGSVPVVLDSALTSAIRSFAQSAQTTAFVVLLAAHAAVLRERIADDDVLVAIAVTRRQPQTQPLIGFFTGAICIRMNLGGDPAFAELIRRVHGACMSGIAREELDLTAYLHLVEPSRDEDADPVACAGLFLQPPSPRFSLAGAQLEPVEVGHARTPSEPEIALRDTGQSIHGSLNYAAKVFSEPSARAFVDQFTGILRSGVRQPGARLSEL